MSSGFSSLSFVVVEPCFVHQMMMIDGWMRIQDNAKDTYSFDLGWRGGWLAPRLVLAR
jgi:hypothetical protein